VAEARRELAEETGLKAGRLRLLGRIDDSHGISTQRLHIFLATELEPGEPAREHTEQGMRQRQVSRAELERMIRTGLITDSSSLAAYMLLTLDVEAP
jgi:8-oxo-dGTP pyrophosphatase MutT (NUDIX family)